MIIVTGCAGFIGSNLCIKLIKLGYQVLGIDGLLEGSNLSNLDPIFDLSNKFYLEIVDIRKEKELNIILNRYNYIDCIIHLAAESHVDRSIKSDKNFWDTNVVGTSNILRWALKNNTKVLNQITDEVYGPKITGLSLEGDSLLPTSPYAASKAAQYLVGQSYYKTYNLPVISTFPANTFGPRQHIEKLIPKFITNLLNNKTVPLMKSSHFERDWLPVEDHINALIFLMNNGTSGENYNISGLGLYSNKKIAELLLSLLDKDSSYIEEVPDRKSHDCRYCVDDTKIRNLGWKPKYDFLNYLIYTINWYKENYDSISFY